MKRGRLGVGVRRMLLAAVLPLTLASSTSAHAQDPLTRFLDGIFKQERPASGRHLAPQPAPQTIPQPSPGSPPAPPVRGGAPSQAAPQPVSASQPQSLGQPLPAAQVPAQAGVHPLPPRRPAGLGGAAVAQAAPPAAAAASHQVAAAPGALPAQASRGQQPAMPRNANEAVARVNAYLNSINTLTARFLQTGGDRQQVGGSLYVQRPGRLRFAYDPPSTLEIVADGRSVAVRDSRLRTNDVYSIGQTPLKFLLRDNVDLARDMRVRDVSIDPGGLVAISVEDSATLGGTSRVTLDYDARANVLRGWRIVDPQGYETHVSLSGVEVAWR